MMNLNELLEGAQELNSESLAGLTEGAVDLKQASRDIAKQYNIDPDIFERLVQRESQYNPTAVSPKGAKGLTQLMPETAKELGVSDPFDPIQSLDGGARYLRKQLDAHNQDYSLGLAAYNAGAGNVAKHKGIPPFPETQEYVKAIMSDGVTAPTGEGKGAAKGPAVQPAAGPSSPTAQSGEKDWFWDTVNMPTLRQYAESPPVGGLGNIPQSAVKLAVGGTRFVGDELEGIVRYIENYSKAQEDLQAGRDIDVESLKEPNVPYNLAKGFLEMTTNPLPYISQYEENVGGEEVSGAYEYWKNHPVEALAGLLPFAIPAANKFAKPKAPITDVAPPEISPLKDTPLSEAAARAQADMQAAAVESKLTKTEKQLAGYERHTYTSEESRAKSVEKAASKGIELEPYETADGKLKVRKKQVVEEPAVEEAPTQVTEAVPAAVSEPEVPVAGTPKLTQQEVLGGQPAGSPPSVAEINAEGKRKLAEYGAARRAEKARKEQEQLQEMVKAAEEPKRIEQPQIVQPPNILKEESKSVQPSDKLPPAPKGISKPIYEAMQAGSFIVRNPETGIGWVVDIGGKLTKVPEKTIAAMGRKQVIEWNPEAQRYELAGKAGKTEQQIADEILKPKEKIDVPKDDRVFGSYKSARDAAREKAAETQRPWAPREQMDGTYRIEAGDPGEFGGFSIEPLGHLVDQVKRGLGDLKEKFKLPYKSPDIKSDAYLKGISVNARQFSKQLAWDQEAMFALDDLSKFPEYDRNMWLAVNAGIAPKGYQMPPAMKAYYDSVKQLMNAFRVEFQKYGRLENFVKDYLPLVVKADPQGNPLSAANPFMRRKFRDPIEALTTLMSEGYKIETDAAVFIPQYLSRAGSMLAKLEAMELYKSIPAPDGLPAIRPITLLPRDIKLREDFIPARYGEKLRRMDSPMKFADPALEKAMKDLKSKEIYIHKDLYQTIDSMFTDPTVGFMQLVAQYQSAVKQMIMYNPFIHSTNLAGNFVSAVGWMDTAKALAGHHPALEILKSPEGQRQVLREMALAGVRVEGVYNVRKALGADEYASRLDYETIKPKDLIDNPMLIFTHPFKTISDINSYLVFDKLAKSAQVAHYLIKKQQYMEGMRDPLKGFQRQPGLPEKEAMKIAAIDTNNTVGSIPPYHFTRSQRAWLRFLMFARNWNVGNALQIFSMSERASMNQWLPKFLRTEGLSKEQWLNYKAANRSVILRAVIGAYVSANMLQQAFLATNGKELKPTWKNESGHWLDIDTGLDDKDGKPIYLRNWMYRQVDEYFRMMKEGPFKLMMQKAEPIVSTAARVTINKSGKPGGGAIWGEEAGFDSWHDPESMAAIAKEFLTIMPFDDLYGPTDRIPTVIERVAPLLGTSVRRGISRDVVLSDMMQDYYRYVGKHERLSKQAFKEVNKLHQEGKVDEAEEKAAGYIEMGLMSPGQYKALMKGREAGVLGKLFSRGASDRIQDFFMTMPEKKREAYLKHLEEITE